MSDTIVLFNLPILGRSNFVKDKLGYICGGFVWFTWLYGSTVGYFVVLRPHYLAGDVSAYIVYVYLLVSFMVCLSLIRCNLTDPGRISSTHKPFPNEPIEDKSLCRQCGASRPPRAHHCSKCKQCVAKMDHHCPWINNCVGEENHHHFMQLCHYALMFSSFSLTLVPLHFYYWPTCAACYETHWYLRYSLPLIHGFILISLFHITFMCGQVVQQHYNVVTDATTLEGFIGKSPSNGHVPGSGSTASSEAGPVSLLERYRAVFPRGPMLCWTLPCRRRTIKHWVALPPPV